MSEQRVCPECGDAVCQVRVKGEWVLADWGPVVPVVDLDKMLLAIDGDYATMEDGEVKRSFTS